MPLTPPQSDFQAINAIIARQFASLNWGPERSAYWEAFRGDFLDEAPLYPAARPVTRQTVEAFMARMQGVAGKVLASFNERVLGTEVHVFGNVAVALAGCEITENGSHVTRGVEMLLLVKTDGGSRRRRGIRRGRRSRCRRGWRGVRIKALERINIDVVNCFSCSF
jgi:hypothetical protein